MQVKFYDKGGRDMVTVKVDESHTFEGLAGEAHKQRFKEEWRAYKYPAPVELPKKEAFAIKDPDKKKHAPKRKK